MEHGVYMIHFFLWFIGFDYFKAYECVIFCTLCCLEQYQCCNSDQFHSCPSVHIQNTVIKNYTARKCHYFDFCLPATVKFLHSQFSKKAWICRVGHIQAIEHGLACCCDFSQWQFPVKLPVLLPLFFCTVSSKLCTHLGLCLFVFVHPAGGNPAGLLRGSRPRLTPTALLTFVLYLFRLCQTFPYHYMLLHLVIHSVLVCCEACKLSMLLQ